MIMFKSLPGYIINYIRGELATSQGVVGVADVTWTDFINERG
jgi:hypothetical protein